MFLSNNETSGILLATRLIVSQHFIAWENDGRLYDANGNENERAYQES